MKTFLTLLALASLSISSAYAQDGSTFDPTARDAVVEYGGPDPVVIETDNGPVTISAELAITPEQRQRGMMWREEVPEGTGMLFDFGEERPVSIWMQNTLVSLDVIYIRSDGTIAKIIDHAQPLSRRRLLSDVPVAGVLEVGAGQAEVLGIEPGQLVRHDIFGTASADAEAAAPTEEEAPEGE